MTDIHALLEVSFVSLGGLKVNGFQPVLDDTHLTCDENASSTRRCVGWQIAPHRARIPSDIIGHC